MAKVTIYVDAIATIQSAYLRVRITTESLRKFENIDSDSIHCLKIRLRISKVNRFDPLLLYKRLRDVPHPLPLECQSSYVVRETRGKRIDQVQLFRRKI